MAKMAGLSSLDLHIEQAYSRGSVPASDGTAMTLAPHTIDRAAGEALRDLAIAEGARRTIEVGLALGLSALYLCRAVSEKAGRHVAVDPFQQESWGGAGLRTLRDAGAEQIVEVIEEEFDFAFIDGDHRFEGVFLDLYYMTRLVRPGGLIIVDDLWMPSVRMAVAYVERNLGATLEPDALPNGFRWRRRPMSRGLPDGSGHMAALRLPGARPALAWDAFVAPY